MTIDKNSKEKSREKYKIIGIKVIFISKLLGSSEINT
jgi:hypothetical protein